MIDGWSATGVRLANVGADADRSTGVALIAGGTALNVITDGLSLVVAGAVTATVRLLSSSGSAN